MTKRLLRTPPLVGAVLAALTLSACGNDNGPITTGHNESVNVRAGELVYQVQLSRALNPHGVDDRAYLEGVADPALSTSEQWFGVWVRAQNTTDKPQETADEFKILSADGKEYKPVVIADSNPFKFRPQVVERSTGNGQPVLPDPESVSGSGPIQGSMLLFKVPYSIYQNAPVELEIVPPGGGTPSTVTLDL